MEIITDVARLRQIMGEPGPLTRYKIHHTLSPQAQAYIRQSPFFVLATANAQGIPTVSPKGDDPGFVHIEDERTLLIPERPGNRLLISLENVIRNPQVGLIFISPGTDETLRIGGKAQLLRDEVLNQRFTARGKPALLVLKVAIEESYFHCAKAFLRSALWKPDTWPQRLSISFSAEINLRKTMEAVAMHELDAQIAKRYKTDL